MEMLKDGAKRRRVGEAAGGVSILDVLNADCWRLVLDHLTINDIVRSERVSRAWQRMVLDYLPGVRNFCFEFYHGTLKPCNYNFRKRVILCPEDPLIIKKMIKKMGPFMVTLTSRCINTDELIVIALNCPKLEKLKLWGSTNAVDLSIKDITAEEIANNASLMNLKSLSLYGFHGCGSFLITHAQSVVQQMTSLQELFLDHNSIETLQNVHLLLNEMPNLERLSLRDYEEAELSSAVPASVGRLRRLKELSLGENYNVTDEWMACVARGCVELRVLDVGCCGSLSPRGVVALCQGRPTLVELLVLCLDVTDEDLEACARSCTGLKLLDASYCYKLTRRLPGLLARPRKRPLRLRLRGTDVLTKQVHYEGLKVDWESNSDDDC